MLVSSVHHPGEARKVELVCCNAGGLVTSGVIIVNECLGMRDCSEQWVNMWQHCIVNGGTYIAGKSKKKFG